MLPRLFAFVATGLLAACGSLAGGDRGALVIVGGGLRAENAAVLGAFVERAGERIAVLPTASGVPEESGPGTAEDIAAYAAPGQSVEVFEFLATTPERAQDPTWHRRLGTVDDVWFTGGVQSRITAVFRPDGRDSKAYRQVVAMLERDGCIAGTSAGAAMMCDPMIVGGSSRAALLEGVGPRGVEIGQGMGFFTFGTVDQHFLRRGRIGRLVVVMDAVGNEFGWGIADNCAMVVDRGAATGVVLGDRAVVQVDARAARRDGPSFRDLRVAVLSSGDRIDFAEERIEVDPGKDAVAPIDDLFHDRSFVPLDPFGADVLSELLERLSTDPSVSQRAERAGIALVVRADEATRFFARDRQLGDFTVVNALLDIEVDPAVAADPLLAPRR